MFTNDDALAKVMREVRTHGQERRYYHTRIGVGGRMDTIQCAVLLAKMERFEWEVEQRLALGRIYRQKLEAAQLPLRLVQVPADRDSVFAQFTVVVENRAAVQKRMQELGVPLSLNRQPAYLDDVSAAETVHSHWAADRVMSLPFSPDLTLGQMDRVVAALGTAMARVA